MAIDRSEITVGKQMGAGGFSVVYQGEWMGTPVAIKMWLHQDTAQARVLDIRAEVMTLAVRVRCHGTLHHDLTA
jgi:predicted Ser/Thr protein kinase